MTSSSFLDQQRANRRRSALLVTAFILFFAWIGFGADLILYLFTVDSPPEAYHHLVPFVGLALTAVAGGITVFGIQRGPRQILWSSGAREITDPATDLERVFRNVVEEMAVASGLPVPRTWIVPDVDPNAFATGLKPDESHVAVTQGLLELLNRDELQAVVAHEVAHIRNHDVRLMTLLAALIGVMALIADGSFRALRFGGMARGRSSGGKKVSPLAIVLLVVWVISVILAPLVSRLLALGVSRKREFLADATAAQFTRNPAALAEALRKIEDRVEPTASIHRGSAHLCIADPVGRRLTHKSGFVADLLATHPPMAVRVARLRRMAYVYRQTGEIPEEV